MEIIPQVQVHHRRKEFFDIEDSPEAFIVSEVTTNVRGAISAKLLLSVEDEMVVIATGSITPENVEEKLKTYASIAEHCNLIRQALIKLNITVSNQTTSNSAE